MFQVRWSVWGSEGLIRSGLSLAYASKAEAIASAEAERKAGRGAKVVCATCGEGDPDLQAHCGS
jgi:hypothetical protein